MKPRHKVYCVLTAADTQWQRFEAFVFCSYVPITISNRSDFSRLQCNWCSNFTFIMPVEEPFFSLTVNLDVSWPVRTYGYGQRESSCEISMYMECYSVLSYSPDT